MKSLEVQVVSADGVVWGGTALSVLVRTTEGDVGILPEHEPFLAALVPCAGEITAVAGQQEIVALDSGFVSVSQNHVSVLAPNAAMSGQIDLDQAEKNLAKAERLLDEGQDDEAVMMLYHKSLAHVIAVNKARGIKKPSSQ